jgi:hypothetical protein
MKQGFWNVKSKDGKMNFNVNVIKGENTIFFQDGNGEYVITPEKDAGAKLMSVDENFMPGK